MNKNLNEWFIETGENPSNTVIKEDIDLFPKIKSLRELKNNAIESNRLHPPLYIKGDLRTMDLLCTLQTEFESILIDPPWYEYYARAGGFPPVCNHGESHTPYWSYEEIRRLRIEDIGATPGFCFIWCGNRHVEQATACLLKWGYRRIEDVCWVKTNDEKTINAPDFLPRGILNILRTTKEHLLVGIKGSVNRSRDGQLIHANIDSDVIIAPQEHGFGCTKKPEEIYGLIERFCNSQRRLELFGHSHNLRPGWVTVGSSLSEHSNYDPEEYRRITDGPRRFIPQIPEIERLRPKSPRRSLGSDPERSGPKIQPHHSIGSESR
jgi:N6-adenosine-specific RNA methylase IME4